MIICRDHFNLLASILKFHVFIHFLRQLTEKNLHLNFDLFLMLIIAFYSFCVNFPVSGLAENKLFSIKQF